MRELVPALVLALALVLVLVPGPALVLAPATHAAVASTPVRERVTGHSCGALVALGLGLPPHWQLGTPLACELVACALYHGGHQATRSTSGYTRACV